MNRVENIQEEYLNNYLKLKKEEFEGTIREENVIQTGLNKLDNKIHGFSGGELITIFAFSGVGKSTLAGQIALNIAQQQKQVMFFSLEMTYTQVMDRLVSNFLDIDHKKIKYITKGSITKSELEQIKKASISIHKNINIYNDRNLQEIIKKIKEQKSKKKINIVFIDYISLIEVDGFFEERSKITKITQEFKKLSNELNIPIVILAQATQNAGRKSADDSYSILKKLEDTDIADSASVFRDSDTVIGVYRNTSLDFIKTEKYAKDSKDAGENPNIVNIYINKCRNSTKQILAFKWKGSTFRIED